MRRLTTTILGTCMLGAATAGVLSAQQPTAGPVGIGGRIELPAAGFALTVPDDWLWADTSSGDLEGVASLVEATDPVSATSLSPILTHWPEGQDLPDLYLLGPMGPGGAMESCTVTTRPSSGDSLDARMADAAVQMAAAPEWSVTDTLQLDLPAGPAGRLDWVSTFASPMGEVDIPGSGYYLTSDKYDYVIDCFAPVPPDDRWLSIAETFESLPVDGATESP